MTHPRRELWPHPRYRPAMPIGNPAMLHAITARQVRRRFLHNEVAMLRLALAFLLVALIAALFGFGFIATTSVAIAKTLFLIFAIGFFITLVLGLSTRRRIPL